MSRLGEKKRLREARLVGITTGKPSYIPPELETRGFKLKFYDVSDNKIGEIGSDVKVGRVASIEFELMPFGCGAFTIVLDDEPDFNISYRTRVDIHPYFDEQPWFTGFIQSIPKTGERRPFEYSGFGFYEQLDWVTVTKSYQSQEISLIIKDIIQNYVAPNTQIIYNESKIESTSYTVNSIDFDHTLAKDAVQTLTDMAGSYEFGVDNSREFYFRAVDTETHYFYWVGKHYQDIEIEEDPLSVRNRLYIKIGEIQSEGSNIIGYVEDGSSISQYGLREEVVTVPEILNSDDAVQWANLILQEKKDPKVIARLKNIFLDATKEKIEPKGKVRVTVYDGTEYNLQIKRASYSISAEGILAELELGSLIIPLEEYFVNLIKEVNEEKRLGDKRAEQLFTEKASISHDHDDRYFTESEVDSKLQAQDEFIELIDTPSSYSGEGDKFLKVKSSEDGIEFVEVSGGGSGVPVGSIIPYLGGYFTNGSNGGFAMVMASANTIEAVNVLLNPDGWYVCDGSELNDPESPIFNGSGRYLPNLTDDRFIMGDTVGGGVGGDNSMAHTHGIGSYTMGSSGSHSHSIDPPNTTTSSGGSHAHSINPPNTYTSYSGGHSHSVDPPSTSTSTGGSHTHGVGSYSVGSHKHIAPFRHGASNAYIQVTESWGTATATSTYRGSQSWASKVSSLTGWPYTSSTTPSFSGTSGSGGSHSHTVDIGSFTSGSVGDHRHTVDIGSFTSGSSGSHTHDVNISSFSSGSSGSHTHTLSGDSGGASYTENRPKFLGMFFIMKIK